MPFQQIVQNGWKILSKCKRFNPGRTLSRQSGLRNCFGPGSLSGQNLSNRQHSSNHQEYILLKISNKNFFFQTRNHHKYKPVSIDIDQQYYNKKYQVKKGHINTLPECRVHFAWLRTPYYCSRSLIALLCLSDV